MKKLSYTILFGALLLTGCASNDYALYTEAQKSMAQSKAIAEAARYNALAEIAKTGDTAAKVAAVITLNMGNGTNTQNTQSIAAPKTLAETALQWTSILLPSLTQIYGINKNAEINISQSNNAALVAKSTNDAFVGISSKIQAPQANVTTTNTDSSNRSTNTTTTSSVGRDNNTGSNSGVTGRVAGGNLTDNTSTPTVVKPEVVNTTTTTTTTTNNSSNNTTGTTGP